MRTPNTNECNINICTKSHNIEGPNRRLTLKQYRASAIDRELAIPWVPRQPQFHVLIAGTRNIFMGSSGDSTLRFGGFLKMLILYCVRVGGPHGRIGRSRKGMRWPLLQPRPLASNCPEWGLLKMTTCACRGQRLRFWRAPSGKAPVASHAAARRIPRHERDALVRMLGESVALASARALCSRRAVARLCVPHISRAPSPDASRRQPPPPPRASRPCDSRASRGERRVARQPLRRRGLAQPGCATPSGASRECCGACRKPRGASRRRCATASASSPC